MSKEVTTLDRTQGKWKDILLHAGATRQSLSGRNGPCPFCNGHDRFRFLNSSGSGSWICSQCQPEGGTGLRFLMQLTGRDMRAALAWLDGIVGEAKVSSSPTPLDNTAMLRRLLAESVPATTECLVGRYLEGRGISLPKLPPALRFHRALQDGEGGVWAGMLAEVRSPEGDVVTLHRTFLEAVGAKVRKAPLSSPRKMMPGPIPEGSCVRLWRERPTMGIAEGIETALAAAVLHRMPVWAAISAGGMAKWVPPVGVETVIIYADHDHSHAGHEAAYRLSRRLRVTHHLETQVVAPEQPGEDWADVITQTEARRAS